MVQAIRMPMMGNTMEIGLLAEWRVEAGEDVEADDVVAVVESEKAAADVVADRDGVLARIDVEEGEEVPPGTLLGVIVGPDDALEDAPPPRSRIEPGEESDIEPDSTETTPAVETPTATSTSDQAGEVRAAPGARKLASEHDIDLATIEGSGPEGAVLIADIEAHLDQEQKAEAPKPDASTSNGSRTFASPSTRRLARDLGVSIDEIDGSGVGGRISESDVRAAAGERDRPSGEPRDVGAVGETVGREPRDPEKFGVTIEAERELSLLRQTIADRMSRSARQAPHVTNKREVAVERTLEAAEDLATELDAPIGFTDLLVAAVTRALETHPEFNAWYEGDRLRLVAERNVAIAVDTDAGLLTPVLREVDDRSIASIATGRRNLTDAVLDGEYAMDDLQGGTFTITNLGMFGVDSFDPIINPPQVAILGVGRIREADDGERTCVLSLSFDHRAVDGADAARFLDTISEGLQSPAVLSASRRGTASEDASAVQQRTEPRGAETAQQTIDSLIADDLEERATEISAVHGWPLPTLDVQLDGSRPLITVDVPDGASPATMKRLTYAACRESEYEGTIAGLSDPDLTLV
jgi:pyruvate/2-oxoglutarate dehydrogenase complex dihydrolipoamide acyltransferase (E2) component